MIITQNVSKRFDQSQNFALRDINLKINNSEFVSIWGRSGSGKTTLLYLLSTLDTPSEGSIIIDGHDVSTLGVKEVHELRNTSIGFIFQFHYLLPELTLLENILLPTYRKKLTEKFRPRAMELIKICGLQGKENRLSTQLSGGEQQRVAIARSLCLNPRYIFADEPTGNLDTKNGEIVMGLLREINQTGTTVVLVTHDQEFAKNAKRRIVLVDGQIQSDNY